MSDLPMYSATDRYRPFSNGTEYGMWLETNCMRGERGCRKYKPEASSSRDGCPIEVAVAMASIGDGCIPARIALRGGMLEPGPGGQLVEPHDPEHPGCKVIVACPEYKGYDERDDRPRRVPRPPEGQLDLLDPRVTPDRERVGR